MASEDELPECGHCGRPMKLLFSKGEDTPGGPAIMDHYLLHNPDECTRNLLIDILQELTRVQ